MPTDSKPDEEETPTSPEIPGLRCPECAGKAPTCDLCAGMGKVTRETFVRWHERRQGRNR